MANTLKTFTEGETIKASDTNDNNEFLLARITTTAENLNTRITTVNSNLSSQMQTMLETIYPVGSIYLSVTATCPIASLFGTWELVSSGKALWTGDGSNANTTIAAGLPNIKGRVTTREQTPGTSGAFYTEENGTGRVKYEDGKKYNILFDASKSNTIYGKSTTVQPPAYVVNAWRRTA